MTQSNINSITMNTVIGLSWEISKSSHSNDDVNIADYSREESCHCVQCVCGHRHLPCGSLYDGLTSHSAAAVTPLLQCHRLHSRSGAAFKCWPDPHELKKITADDSSIIILSYQQSERMPLYLVTATKRLMFSRPTDIRSRKQFLIAGSESSVQVDHCWSVSSLHSLSTTRNTKLMLEH